MRGHKSIACGCQRSAVAAFRKFKKGITLSKKKLEIIFPTGMGSPFDSEQLL